MLRMKTARVMTESHRVSRSMRRPHLGSDRCTKEPVIGSLPLRPTRIYGVRPALEATVPVRIPRVALVKSHFRAREGRADACPGQDGVFGLRLVDRTVIAIRPGCRRRDFLPRDLALMSFLLRRSTSKTLSSGGALGRA